MPPRPPRQAGSGGFTALSSLRAAVVA